MLTASIVTVAVAASFWLVVASVKMLVELAGEILKRKK